MPVWMRGWLVVGGIALASAGVVIGSSRIEAAGGRSQTVSSEERASGRLSEADLGNLIRAMGVEVKLDDRRYDFNFSAPFNKEEWNLSMSAVLSENGSAIWVMAWLDPCPKSAADVPRTALLRLLAKNDTLGNGKFFAYIPANNRFVMQRVIPNEGMTTAKFREILQDLGGSVVETYPYWSVANWKQTDRTRASESMPENNTRSAPSSPPTETRRTNIRQTSQRRAD